MPGYKNHIYSKINHKNKPVSHSMPFLAVLHRFSKTTIKKDNMICFAAHQWD